MKKEKTKLFDGTVRRLMQEAKPIRWWIALSCLLSCGIIVCAVLGPKFLGDLIDKLFAFEQNGRQGKVTDTLLPGLLILLAIYAGQMVVTYANSAMLSKAVSRFFTCTIRIRISDKLQRLPVSYMDKTPTGDIIDRIQEDVSTMGNTIHTIVEMLMTGFLQIIAVSVTMFLADWRLALIVVLLTPASLLLSSKLASRSEKYWDKSFHYFGRMYSAVEEGYTNFPATKAFNLETYIVGKHDKINAEHQDVAFKGYFYADIVQPIITFTNALAYILIALAGGWLIVSGSGVSVGTVVTIIFFAKQFSQPLERLANSFAHMQQAKAASKRVFTILDMEEEEHPEGTISEVSGNIRFEHVDFSYREDHPLIRDLTVDVKPGRNVAIVGPTGAGKTTIVNLLMRFYDIQGGRILIDGQDISKLSRESTRDLFGMVLQDTWLFKGTVAENVAYGKPDATREEIIAACDRAYCDHFIRTLPQGYDTIISEDTTTISAGQKQLLTIARALLADRQLLILDEATSNVDTRTEILIQKAMDKLMKGRTCFVIAHRLSTIVDSDVILVIRDGQIVEQGKHQELLDKKGFYYEIYSSQYAI